MPCRAIREEDVASTLREAVVLAKEPSTAESRLLAMPALQRYAQRLGTDGEREDLRKHLRRYICMYMPDCPFEVSTTNRYTLASHEATIVARRKIKKGETVKYLCGIQVGLTADEEKELDLRRGDFSIVMSSRRKSASVLLGPARFSNHDCDANARLVTTGGQGMEVAAVREIQVGEEITVAYGADYFGPGNRECLCRTCEDAGRSGWTAEAADGSTAPLDRDIGRDDEQPEPYSFRRKRKYPQSKEATPLSSASGQPRKRRRLANETPDPVIKTDPDVALPECALELSCQSLGQAEQSSVSPPKTAGDPQNACGHGTQITDGVGALAHDGVDKGTPQKCLERALCGEATPSGPENSLYEQSAEGMHNKAASTRTPSTSHDIDLKAPLLPTSVAQQDRTYLSDLGPGSEITRGSSPHSFQTEDYKNSGILTEATSICDDSLIAPASLTNVPRTQPNPEGASAPVVDKIEADGGPDLAIDDSSSCPSEISDGQLAELAGTVHSQECAPARKPKARKAKDGVSPCEVPDNSVPTAVVRVPGDYVRNRALLSTPYAAWVTCTICKSAFVQIDAYFTRVACPRCERHSKLYGYQWPKTDREGRDDHEKRVMDHRTVHRFIRPEEEKEIRKGKIRDVAASHSIHNAQDDQVYEVEEGGGYGIWRRPKRRGRQMSVKAESTTATDARSGSQDRRARGSRGGARGRAGRGRGRGGSTRARGRGGARGRA